MEMNELTGWFNRSTGGFTRRRLLGQGGISALLGALGGSRTAKAALTVGPDLYKSVGVKPVINCKGTFTIMSGSLTLPEVKQAMLEASKHFVHIDELMDAVGKRIAEITGAESAIVTCGCAAALTHATAAAIAGGDPEKIQRLPDLTGLKNEVIAPDYSRNVYDHALRMVGVKMVTVSNLDELRHALSPRTAMVMVLGTPADTGPFGLEPVAEAAHERGVPVLVDAAAEGLTIPNVHLRRGADLVAYSGGKALRGPQSAGLLIGRKDLIRAAWTNSAPHHAFGRPMKVGKEDIVGMLAAVEMWVKRDHDAEWKMWESWLAEIARSVERVDGVTTNVLQPRGLSNYSPRLEIRWNPGKVGIHGKDLENHLWNSNPRIILASGTGTRREGGDSTVSVMPWQMQPGDAEVVADVLYQKLSNPPNLESPTERGSLAKVAGQWDVDIDYPLAPARHTVFIEQSGDELSGSHHGDMTGGDIEGWVEGDSVHFSSRHRWEGAAFGFNFSGTVQGDTMAGELDMGEYFTAKWSARRHQYA
jgi:D-glucosaminate-6-phosphate ammonia-lyase